MSLGSRLIVPISFYHFIRNKAQLIKKKIGMQSNKIFQANFPSFKLIFWDIQVLSLLYLWGLISFLLIEVKNLLEILNHEDSALCNSRTALSTQTLLCLRISREFIKRCHWLLSFALVWFLLSYSSPGWGSVFNVLFGFVGIFWIFFVIQRYIAVCFS